MASINRFILYFVYKGSFIIALQMTLAVILSFFASYSLHRLNNPNIALIGALWSMISAILVTQATNKESLAMAWSRILGSLMGSILAAVFIYLMGYDWWAIAISLFVTVVACSLTRIEGLYRLACITICIIFIIGKMNPQISPWFNASLRFIESFIGVTIALIIAIPLKPLRVRIRTAYERLHLQI